MPHANWSLAPGFLIAPPSLQQEFRESVILLVAHEEEGSLGIIINRNSSLLFWDVIKDLEMERPPHAHRRRPPPVWNGGPVHAEAGHVLYEHEIGAAVAPGMRVTPTLSLSPARATLEAAAAGELTGRFALILGHAGWGPGQLEQELNEGTWLHAKFAAELLFDTSMDGRWRSSYSQLLGVDPGEVMSVKGGAQA
jgi:putative transcriptional regulator